VNRMKVLTVLGTRPEVVKMAPVLWALGERESVDSRVCNAGQHRELTRQMLAAFRIKPQLSLDLMHDNQSPAEVHARSVAQLHELLGAEKPALVLAQGDTTTVLATALACFYHRLPMGHVEAGLRTGTLATPFPEEMNRVVVARLAALHFAPTAQARDNLLKEGCRPATVFLTGNPVVDALAWMCETNRTSPPDIPGLPEGVWRELAGGGRPLVTVTCHRRENQGEGLRALCRALVELTRARPEVELLFPVHLNPNVSQVVHELLGGIPGIRLLAPLPYPAFVELLRCSSLVITDSGGVQEEAVTLGRPLLVLRRATERPEAVESGGAVLTGTDVDGILTGALAHLPDGDEPRAPAAPAPGPFGDGLAGPRIVDIIEHWWKEEGDLP